MLRSPLLHFQHSLRFIHEARTVAALPYTHSERISWAFCAMHVVYVYGFNTSALQFLLDDFRHRDTAMHSSRTRHHQKQ